VLFVLWFFRYSATKPHPNMFVVPGARLHEIVSVTLDGAVTAGREIVDLRQRVTQGKLAELGTEPVTIADERSNAILAAMELGGLAVVSEEGVSSGLIPVLHTEADPVLFVDPLDATQEYTEDLTQYVSLQMCVTQCGHVLASVLHFPFTGHTMLYRRGAPDGEVSLHNTAAEARAALQDAAAAAAMTKPALLTCACHQPSERLAGARIAVAPHADAASAAAAMRTAVDADLHRAAARTASSRAAALQRALPQSVADAGGALRLVITRSHLRNESRSETGTLSLRSAVEALQAMLPNTRLVRAGGAGYKLAGVLTGEFDAYIHDGPIRQWDVCAGGALLKAAGGTVTDWVGEEHTYCLPERESDGGTRGAGATVLGGKKPKKASFAVRGLVATRDPALHDFLLRVIRGEFGSAA
jgi:3'-phosphoadenosine 5'-phosphosulfate (PAPS) 3'-phosphatase